MTIYILRDGIDAEQLSSWGLLMNPHPAAPLYIHEPTKIDHIATNLFGSVEIVQFLLAHPKLIEWGALSANPNAAAVLRRYPERIDPLLVMYNKALAMDYIADHPDCLHDERSWLGLSENPAAVELFEQHIERLDWRRVSQNPAAIPFLEQHPDRIDWTALSRNPSAAAMQLLAQHVDRIDWWALSTNSAPEAIALLEQHPDMVCAGGLSFNRGASLTLWERHAENLVWRFASATAPVAFLLQHAEHIDYNYLSINPDIFTDITA